MERITTADVGKAFTAFLENAKREGFNTEGWTLYKGTSDVPWELMHVTYVPTGGEGSAHAQRLDSTPFPRYLGSSAREAYGTLTAWSSALNAMRTQRAYGSDLPMLVQRHPDDKWRWMPGGAYGRSYCELYRIPRDGSKDFVSYGQSIDCRAKQANILCGQLNEALAMGGMLADKPDWMG